MLEVLDLNSVRRHGVISAWHALHFAASPPHSSCAHAATAVLNLAPLQVVTEAPASVLCVSHHRQSSRSLRLIGGCVQLAVQKPHSQKHS